MDYWLLRSFFLVAAAGLLEGEGEYNSCASSSSSEGMRGMATQISKADSAVTSSHCTHKRRKS